MWRMLKIFLIRILIFFCFFFILFYCDLLDFIFCVVDVFYGFVFWFFFYFFVVYEGYFYCQGFFVVFFDYEDEVVFVDVFVCVNYVSCYNVGIVQDVWNCVFIYNDFFWLFFQVFFVREFVECYDEGKNKFFFFYEEGFFVYEENFGGFVEFSYFYFVFFVQYFFCYFFVEDFVYFVDYFFYFFFVEGVFDF